MKSALLSRLALMLVYALLLTQLSSCSTIPEATKQGFRKGVVLNAISTEVTRYHVGLTVFTNKGPLTSQFPELRPQLDSFLKQELSQRLPNAKIVFDSATAGRIAETKKPAETKALIASAAQQAQADFVITVRSHRYYPYGIPSYMSAAHGLWHGGSLEAGSATAESYVVLEVIDPKTGKVIGTGFPNKAGEEAAVSYPLEGSDFSAAERAKVIEAIMKGLTKKLTNSLNQVGL